MSSVVAELMLAEGALLNGSWWVARWLRADDGRRWTGLIWTCIALAVVGVGVDLALAPKAPTGGAVVVGLTAAVDGLFLLVIGARAARALPARRQLARARKARESGNTAGAADAYGKAASHLGSAWKRVSELKAIAEEGHMRLEAGQAAQAAECFARLGNKAKAYGDVVTEARALRWSGDAAFELGDRQRSRSFYWEAANSGQALASPVLVGHALARLGWMEHIAGDPELARDYFAWAANLDIGEADLRLTGSLMLLAAAFRLAEGRLETARPAAEDGTRVSGQVKDVGQETTGRFLLGCVQYLEGLYESGGQMIEEQSAGKLPIQSRRLAGVLAAGMSFAARRLNRPADANGFATLATRLLAGHPILSTVAAHAADPSIRPAYEDLHVEALVHPLPAAPEQASAAV